MAKKRSKKKDYSEKLKAIRPFVDFNYDLRRPLSSAAKAKISRYHRAISEIQARANKVYRSTDRAKVRQVQEFGRNEFENLPGIKVAFYESPPSNPQRVRFKRGQLTVKGEAFQMGFLPLDPRRLTRDAPREVERAMNSAKPARWYRIGTGKFSIAQAFVPREVTPQIQRLMNQYSVAADGRALNNGKSLNHRWDRWLNGLIPLYVENQRTLEEFVRADARERRERLKARKKARNAQRKKDKARGRRN